MEKDLYVYLVCSIVAYCRSNSGRLIRRVVKKNPAERLFNVHAGVLTSRVCIKFIRSPFIKTRPTFRHTKIALPMGVPREREAASWQPCGNLKVLSK